ncbi:hypothetical protein [Rhodopirellula bahusiensis]|uniref:hypothetical protein n=1 Tax=Rhodopirellula bahusiensis TaxID=2014065 RepID=UPI003265F591
MIVAEQCEKVSDLTRINCSTLRDALADAEGVDPTQSLPFQKKLIAAIEAGETYGRLLQALAAESQQVSDIAMAKLEAENGRS